MKGIREAALSEDEPIKKPPKNPNGYYDPYDYNYDTDPYTGYPEYNPRQDSLFEEELEIIKGQLKITVLIGINLLGDLINEQSPQFDINKAYKKAEELAWQEVEKFAAPDFRKKYTQVTIVKDNIESLEVVITLNPIK